MSVDQGDIKKDRFGDDKGSALREHAKRQKPKETQPARKKRNLKCLEKTIIRPGW